LSPEIPQIGEFSAFVILLCDLVVAGPVMALSIDSPIRWLLMSAKLIECLITTNSCSIFICNGIVILILALKDKAFKSYFIKKK